MKSQNKYIHIVPLICGVKLADNESMDIALNKALEKGYEGIVARDPLLLYPTRKERSNDMIKYKPWLDSEYICIGARASDVDAHKDLIVFEVQDPNSSYIKFLVTPKSTHDERKKMWNEYQANPTQFIGKKYTVKYRELNEFGVPVEAVGLGFRDDVE